MSNAWYYTAAGKQLGPIDEQQMKDLVNGGAIDATALVWTQGLPAWQPLSSVRDKLMGTAPAASHQLTPQQPQGNASIGYYNPTGGLQERVLRTLKGFPVGTGVREDFPLSEMQLIDLAATEKSRRAIRNLAATMRALGALWAIGGVVFLAVMVGVAASGSSRGMGMAAWSMVLLFLIFGALTALAFIAARATLRCQIWAPIAFLCLMGLVVLLNLVGIVSALAASTRDAPVVIISNLLGLLIPLIVLIACIRGIGSIRKFLASPIWCQEALVFSKL
jgi:hypothetical protein